MPGQGSALDVTAPPAVKLTAIADNHDGTYTFTAAATTPGNYLVTASLNGFQIGTPAAINFLSAACLQAKVTVGQVVTANAMGFQPGEQVTVVAHSTPVTVGVFTADSTGRVTAQFPVPADFNVGTHSVDFTGTVSGHVTAAFDVVAAAQAAQGSTGPRVSTGGTVDGWPTGSAIALVLLGLATVAGTIAIRARRRYPQTR